MARGHQGKTGCGGGLPAFGSPTLGFEPGVGEWETLGGRTWPLCNRAPADRWSDSVGVQRACPVSGQGPHRELGSGRHGGAGKGHQVALKLSGRAGCGRMEDEDAAAVVAWVCAVVRSFTAFSATASWMYSIPVRPSLRAPAIKGPGFSVIRRSCVQDSPGAGSWPPPNP